MPEQHFETARQMLDDLAAKKVSARELLDAHVARNEAVHGALNAVVAVDLDAARKAAQKIDDARANGGAPGPLAGLPMSVKDCFDVDGLPSTAGAPAFANRPKRCADAALVKTVRDAGAIIWGKTNVPLMAGDIQTYNEVYGVTNNPYDLTRTPGGSSGGAAAALASGITPLEIGSDIGGSLRQPANFCGVTALKPTWGQLPLRGHVPPPPGINTEPDLGVAGPMARTVGDLRLLYDVMRGQTAKTRPIKGARVALWTDEPEFHLSADVRAALEAAADMLRRKGATVTPVKSPVNAAKLVESYFAILIPIVSAGLPDETFNGLTAMRGPSLEALKAGAGRYGAPAYIVNATASYRDVAYAMAQRQALKDDLAAFFDEYDAILAPNHPTAAFTHNNQGTLVERMLDCDNRQIPYMQSFDWIALATSLHAPALSLRVGATPAGLPIGAQLIGRWDEESFLLDLGEALEQETGGFIPPPL